MAQTMASVVSGALTPYRHKTIKTSLLTAIGIDQLKSFRTCYDMLIEYGRATKDFSGNNYLAGKMHVHVQKTLMKIKNSKIKKLPPDDKNILGFNAAVRYARANLQMTKTLCEVNRLIASGEYISVPGYNEADIETKDQLHPLQVATGVAKEATVAKAVNTSSVKLFDAGGGRGVAVKHAIRLGVLSQIDKYHIVDLDSAKIAGFMASDFKKTADFLPDALGVFNMDVNKYYVSKFWRDNAVILALNTAHYFNYNILKRIMIGSNHSLFGIGMMSDLLFYNSDVITASDFSVKFDKPNNLVTGKICNYPVMEQPLVTSMFKQIYPLKFLHPYRFSATYGSDHPFWRSFCYIFNNDQFGTSDIPARLGKPWVLINGGYRNRNLLRPSMHTLDANDYRWHDRIGCYVSPKLNGLGAFLHFSDGHWVVSLRGGQTLIPYHVKMINGVAKPTTPFKFDSLRPGEDPVLTKIFIEIVHIDGFDYPFFLHDLPPNYKKKQPKEYWDDRWLPFNAKMIAAKSRYPGLSFKPYYSFGKNMFRADNKSLVLPFMNDKQKFVPADGLVMTDPLGNYHNYWKYVETIDVEIEFVLGKPRLANYPFKVEDPRKICSYPGIYEAIRDRDTVILGAHRPDKLRETNLYHVSGIGTVSGLDVLGSTEDKLVKLGTTIVYVGKSSKNLFVQGHMTRPYELVLERVISTHLPICD